MANSTDENTSIIPVAKPAKERLSLGQRLVQTDPEELNALVTEYMDKLLALGSDEKLPVALQQAVKDLAALASAQKPGMEEVTTAWRVPRVNIVQPTSQSGAKPEAAKNGDLYTTAG